MTVALCGVLLALIASGTGLLAGRHRLLFPLLLGASGLLALAAGLIGLCDTPGALTLPLGLPWLPWHLRLDALSGLFLALLGCSVLAVALYLPDYQAELASGPQPVAVLHCNTGLFVAGMQLVLLADDAFAFMVAWELMSVASYFLVTFQHQNASNRRAGFLYLLMAHISGVAILLAFGVLAAFGGDFTFAALRAGNPGVLWSSVAFALALFGFGMKAGLVPLHAWLPEAHPAAPSHISALMSGVMLKVAVYGFVRLVFDLLPLQQGWWGVLLLVIGGISALFGILHALLQSDIKRLLAYSSVENLGIIFMALGLSLIFLGQGHAALGALGLVAALFHAFNHSLFKGLLFLVAGTVVRRTHEHDIERMGGLIRVMPWTALLGLVGVLSIGAIPPLNGFASEWLTFQTALQAPALGNGALRAVIPLSAALLALAAALSAAAFVKLYGIAFLGVARSRRVRHARESGRLTLLAMAVPAAGCTLTGVFATSAIELITRVTEQLLDQGLPGATQLGWMWLTPVAPEVASYSAPLVFGGVALAVGTWMFIRLVLRPQGKVGPVVRTPAWDCGFGPLSARAQYTAESFSQPFRRVFAAAWRLEEHIEVIPRPGLALEAAEVQHRIQVHDHTWGWFYQPVERLVVHGSRLAGLLQTGHLRHYLAYTLSTILFLLWLIS